MGIPERLDQLQSEMTKHGLQETEALRFLEELRNDIAEHERQLNIIAIAGAELSKEQEQNSVLELILSTACDLTNADAGTVYSVAEEYYNDPFNPGEVKSKSLIFEVMHTESKNVHLIKPQIPPVPMEIDGEPNSSHVSAYCANTGEIINIPDVYDAKGFDFSGAKWYDENNDYRSKSMLVLPLRDHENEIIGVLQLINRQTATKDVVAFTQQDETIVHGMAYQAAISLTTQKLLRAQVELFNSFVQVIAKGLGEKSEYTYGHIKRVAQLTTSLAEAINSWDKGIYRSIYFDKSQMEEMNLAGWMQDIGKLTMPEHVLSKSIKLQLLYDKFETIVQRFNSKIKDVEISALKKKIKGLEDNEPPEFYKKIKEEKRVKIKKLVNNLQLLNKTNLGGEFLAEEDEKLILAISKQTTVQNLAVKTARISGEERISGVELASRKQKEPLISEMEKSYLTIQKGTLSPEERKIISDHADRSWRWLMALPFPKNRIKLPLYAGTHHEHLKGTGYPNKLKADQLPIQSRIIAVADIFEALTANDRPYKKPMKLSKALDILGNMVKFEEIDAEVVNIFLESKEYLKYAKEYLIDDQITPVDIDEWQKKYYPQNFSNAWQVSKLKEDLSK